MMPLLYDFIGQQLQWKRPRFFTTTYELKAGELTLASIRRLGMTRGHLAEVEGQGWNFKREGFIRQRVVIYPMQPAGPTSNEPAQPLASIQTNWRKNGQLLFRDGRAYNWTHTGNWRPAWSWQDASGTTLLTIKKSRLLEFTPAASESPDLTLLTLFGFYLILLMEEDAAAATSAASTVG